MKKFVWKDKLGRVLSSKELDDAQGYEDQLIELLKEEWHDIEVGDSITMMEVKL